MLLNTAFRQTNFMARIYVSSYKLHMFIISYGREPMRQKKNSLSAKVGNNFTIDEITLNIIKR